MQALADRLKNGEAANLLIIPAPLMEQLRAQAKIVVGDRIIVAKVGVSAFVRQAASKPDISSADAFKRSMLAASSITYPDLTGSGASRHFGFQASMRAMPIIAMQPVWQFRRSLVRVLIRGSIGPFAKCGLDEALGLALSLRSVRLGEDLTEAKTLAGCAEGL
jgi:hypothetical protein